MNSSKKNYKKKGEILNISSKLVNLNAVEKTTLEDWDIYNSFSFYTDSIKAFLEKNRLGKYKDEDVRKEDEEQQFKDLEEERLAKSFVLEQQCEL